MNSFLKSFNLSWSSFTAYLPALLGGIACFILTVVLANLLSRAVSRYSLKRTKDSLIANFLGKVVWAVIFILGAVLGLGILGLGTISNKILAGAGITTFVIGFALKDIGENFLAGLIIAFSRPFHVGSLIECGNVKGIVNEMTMRQTTVTDNNGRIVLIPNSMIVNSPLTRYSNNENNLRQEFTLFVETARVRLAMKIISETILSFDHVARTGQSSPKVIADSLTGDKIKLLVVYWLDGDKFTGSRSGSRSDIILEAIKKLDGAGISISG